MIHGLGGTVTFPVGTVGAARQAEAVINSVRPGSAGVTGFIPEGKGDNDMVTLGITIGTVNYDAVTVENLVKSGDTPAIISLLTMSGIQATDPGINAGVTVSTVVPVRPMQLVDMATQTVIPTPQQASNPPIMTPNVTDTSGTIFGFPTTYVLGAVGVGLALYLMEKS
jgi:hypothetical protein